jgi:hypothetical protein
MTTRHARIVAALLGLGLLTACAGQITPEQLAAECTGLAGEVAQSGLTGTPTQQQVRDVAARLDGRLSDLRDPSVHDAAVSLHQNLHALEEALKDGDASKAQRATQAARDDAASAAQACGMPVERFLG